jgi:anti-sigma-K factor RskA
MATRDNELHTLAGAYALDAVTDEERERFAAHLAGCEQCDQEIRELQEATARLGRAEAVDPRAELKRLTIQAASRITQQAPPGGREDARASLGSRRLRAAPSLLRAAPGRLLPRLALAVTALATAGAVGLGVVTHDQMRQLHDSQRQGHLIAVVLNAPDRIMMTARIRTGGMATVVMSHRAHAVVFTAHGLPALPTAEGYQLWLMGPTGDRSAGLLRVPADGMAGPAVLSGLGGGDMIGLTVEPVSGSHRPTSAPIVLIRA